MRPAPDQRQSDKPSEQRRGAAGLGHQRDQRDRGDKLMASRRRMQLVPEQTLACIAADRPRAPIGEITGPARGGDIGEAVGGRVGGWLSRERLTVASRARRYRAAIKV